MTTEWLKHFTAIAQPQGDPALDLPLAISKEVGGEDGAQLKPH